MIYITGDTHGEFGRFSNKRMRKQGLELGENDFVIVCGDLGLCWAKDKTFTWLIHMTRRWWREFLT